MKRRLNCGLCLVLGASITACATVSNEKPPVEPPREWIGQFEPEDIDCLGIDSTFVNRGEHHTGFEENPVDAFLSEVVFNRRLPGGRIAHKVHINTDVDAGNLSVTLIGDATREVQFQITCDGGWHVLGFSREGQYLGDSVLEKQFDQVSFFRIGAKGELVARVVTEAEFNSMYVFSSKTEAEEWYRFQPDSQQ